jgi:hypothetical protein
MRFETARIPDCPPADLLDAINGAAEAYERLAASGRRLHFETDSDTGKLSIQVLDLEGRALGTIAARKVLDVVSGSPLD